MSDPHLDPSQIASIVSEFYSTTDSSRRAHLDRVLTEFRMSEEGLKRSFDLLNFDQPTVVQHFGANVLYDTIRERWEQCVSREEISSRIKTTLIEKLTMGAHFQNQSVTNKLSSSLALFALYCIPDVWSEPVHDLTILWASQPELLLRVLAELAAEFPRVHMPLQQRCALKSTLLRTAQDVIKVIELVLRSGDTTPSLKNAAIECVEQWLRLPSVNLDEWRSVLIDVFTFASTDFASLTRILTAITSHSDLPSMEGFVLDLCGYVAGPICKEIWAYLFAPGSANGEAGRVNGDFDEMEEIYPLITAVASFAEIALRPLLLRTTEVQNWNNLNSLCSFFVAISTWPGRYCLEEIVSESPETFWSALKEELLSLPVGRIDKQQQTKIVEMCRPHYAALLKSAIEKLAYPAQEEYQRLYDKEQMEKFENYRLSRVDTSVNAFAIVGSETCSYLIETLEGSISENSCCKTEAVLYLLERVADYLTESESSFISKMVELCATVPSWCAGQNVDEARMANELMRLLYSLSHLIINGNDAIRLGAVCVSLALAYVGNCFVAEEALRTLEKYMEERSTSLSCCADEVISKCYEYFMDDRNPKKLRFVAMKNIGYSIFLRDPQFVLESLNSILAPRLQTLQSILEGQVPTSSQSSESLEEECFFELGVFSVLISSLRPRPGEQSVTSGDSPLFLVVKQCLPLFFDLVRAFTSSEALVEKVCDALRSGLVTLGKELEPFIETYLDVLDLIMLQHPATACSLGKTVVLIFSDLPSSTKLLNRIKVWFGHIRDAYQEEIPEEYIEFAYHVVKKDWKLLRLNLQDGAETLTAMVDLAVKVLAYSQNPSLCRKGAVLLSTILKRCADENEFLDLFQGVGQYVLSVAFERLQCEMIKSTTEALAEILMVFARKYPKETRQCLLALPNGDSQAVADILKEAHNSRMFKNLALRYNVQRRKEAKA